MDAPARFTPRAAPRAPAPRARQLSPILRERTLADGGRALEAWCPGCGRPHQFEIHDPGARRARFSWDGNEHAPTIAGVVVELLGDFVCQARVIAGRWHFADDCTHAFAGATTPLPSFPAWA